MNDLRVKRTYILLKNALFELLAHQSFEEIKERGAYRGDFYLNRD